MPTDQILYQVSDHIGTITLNRPEALNAFAGTMREDLLVRLEQAGSDPDVRCIVITGAGRAFCSGGDIAGMVELQSRDDLATIEQRMIVASRIVGLVRTLPKPVIAAVNGAAAGAGMNLALACDLRYAAESARFVESFVKIGLVPDWGGHHLLTHLVGTASALELAMSGDSIDAQEALRLRIVNHVFPDADFVSAVRNRVKAIAAGPPRAIAAIKRGVYFSAVHNLAETFAYEIEAQRSAFLSTEAREGMQAFLDKRAPKF